MCKGFEVCVSVCIFSGRTGKGWEGRKEGRLGRCLLWLVCARYCGGIVDIMRRTYSLFFYNLREYEIGICNVVDVMEVEVSGLFISARWAN